MNTRVQILYTGKDMHTLHTKAILIFYAGIIKDSHKQTSQAAAGLKQPQIRKDVKDRAR